MSSRLSILLIPFLMCASLFAQQGQDLGLNEEFLNSLPDDVRKDLVEQIEENQTNLDKVDFGTFSTKLDENSAKKFIDQELLKNEDTISPLEMGLKDLKIFGSDFFKGIPLTFNPINDPAMGSEYVLDVGDKVTISVIGANIISEELIVAMDGVLNIPKLGKIRIAGLTLEQAEKNFQKFVSDRMTGAEAYLSISSVKNIQVLVVGMAKVPGVYTLAGNSTMLSALNAAGGIALDGSYRNISLMRNGVKITSFDLYPVIVEGDLSTNLMLKSGDSIVIEPVKGHVSIYGGVRRPAKFEPKNDSAKDLLRFAGGLIDNEIEVVNFIDYSKGKYTTSQLVISDEQKNLIGSRDVIYAAFNNLIDGDAVSISGSFSTIGQFSPDQANLVLQNLVISDDAYPLGVLHVTKDRSNTANSFHFTSLENVKQLNAKDELIAFSNQEIQYLNSSFIKDYFADRVELNQSEIASCQLFSHFEDIKNTSRFNLAKEIIFSLDRDNIDIAKNSMNSDMILSEIAESKNSLVSKDLFISEKLNNDQCPEIFSRNPELFISLIMQSSLVEGVDFRSGLYPVPNGLSLPKLVSYSALNTKLNNIEATLTRQSGQSVKVDLNDQTTLIGKFDKLSFASSVNPKIHKVFVGGEVNKPGYYYVGENEKLSDVINRAGSLTSNAYAMGGVLLRESAALLEEQYNKSLYNQVIKSLATVVTRGKPVQLDGLELILSEFKNMDPQGRVITEFDPIKIRRDASLDTILENGDNIFIPKRSGIIYVFGDVLRPGPQKYLAGQNHNHYISKAGGYTQFADKNFVIKVGPNGESELAKRSLFRTSSSVLPGSVIYVSRDLQKLENIELASTIAPIISSIAISIASLNSISNN